MNEKIIDDDCLDEGFEDGRHTRIRVLYLMLHLRNLGKMEERKKKYLTLFITYITLLFNYCLALGDSYVRPMANTRLSGHTYSTLERWTIVYCLMECSNNRKCASFNYNHAGEICELNGFVEVKGKNGEGKFESRSGWTFYKKDANVNVRN